MALLFASAGFLTMTTSLMTAGLLPLMAGDFRVSEGGAADPADSDHVQSTPSSRTVALLVAVPMRRGDLYNQAALGVT